MKMDRAFAERAATGENDWVRARILKQDELIDAHEIAEEACVKAKEALGDRHAAYAIALLNLGLYHDTARDDVAKAAELFAKGRAILGDDHPAYAEALHWLGTFHLEVKQDPERARPPLEEALRIRRRALGANAPEVSDTLVPLAFIQLLARQAAAAVPMLAEAMHIERAALPARPSRLLTTASILARAIGLRDPSALSAAQEDETVELLREILAIQREALGPQHPDVALSLASLADSLSNRNDLRGAVDLYREAIRLRRATLGSADGLTRQLEDHLARICLPLGEYELARVTLQSLLDGAVGSAEPSRLHILNRMTLLAETEGRFAEADDYLQRAARTEDDELDRAFVTTGRDHSITAFLQLECDKVLGAPVGKGPCLKCGKARRFISGDGYLGLCMDCADFMSIGEVRFVGDDSSEERLRLFCDYIAGDWNILDGRTATRALLSNRQALHHLERDQPKNAHGIAATCLETSLRLLGKYHPFTFVAVLILGGAAERLGDHVEAEQRTAEATAYLRRMIGPSCPDPRSVLDRIAHPHKQEMVSWFDLFHPEDPGYVGRVEHSAKLARGFGDLLEARRLFHIALGASTDADGDAPGVSRSTLSDLAQIATLLGDVRYGEELYEHALAAHDEEEPRAVRDRVAWLVGLARLYESAGIWETAEARLSEAFALSGAVAAGDSGPDLDAELATLYLSMGRFEAAESMLHEIIDAQRRHGGASKTLVSVITMLEGVPITKIAGRDESRDRGAKAGRAVVGARGQKGMSSSRAVSAAGGVVRQER